MRGDIGLILRRAELPEVVVQRAWRGMLAALLAGAADEVMGEQEIVCEAVTKGIIMYRELTTIAPAIQKLGSIFTDITELGVQCYELETDMGVFFWPYGGGLFREKLPFPVEDGKPTGAVLPGSKVQVTFVKQFDVNFATNIVVLEKPAYDPAQSSARQAFTVECMGDAKQTRP